MLSPTDSRRENFVKRKEKMSFWTLAEVASMPIIKILLIAVLGAVLATNYFNLLSTDARNFLNKIVFTVFTPSLLFSSLAKTVTFELFISWWFMPINIMLTILIGGIFGWIIIKLLKPVRYLEGIVLATCSSGNMGIFLVIVITAICSEKGNPFNPATCTSLGLSYASFSMAIDGLAFWTITYSQIRYCAAQLKEIETVEENAREADNDLETNEENPREANNDLDTNPQTLLLKKEDTEIDAVGRRVSPFLNKMAAALLAISKVFSSPPTIGAILGFIFGAVTFLRKLIIGDAAPLHVIQDTVTLLGDGTVPCITLILGGNLTGGLRSSKMNPWIIVGVLIIRFAILPAIGMNIIRGVAKLGFLPSDPLYQYVLMVQYAVPPAMNIGTMAQLHNVGKEECSVLFLWTYLVSAPALTIWSTVFMWTLS